MPRTVTSTAKKVVARDKVGAATVGKQVLKTQRTREAIINAVISLIREGGYANASSSRIAGRAGLTWGAAQHHFGSKEEILEAVTNHAHEQFIVRLADSQLRAGSIEERISLLIDTMWEHYQQDVFLAMLEILLAARGFHQETPEQWGERMGHIHLVAIREIFWDLKLEEALAREVLTFAHSFLVGLTIERVFEVSIRDVSRHLQRIKLALKIVLQGG